MNTNKIALPTIVSVICVASWSLAFAAAFSAAIEIGGTNPLGGSGMEDDTPLWVCLSTLIPGLFFGLPAVAGVALVRWMMREEPQAAGYELFGLSCLLTSWGLLVGITMPKYHLRGAWWGWLASACFLVVSAQLGFRCAKRIIQTPADYPSARRIRIEGGGTLGIDVLNALSLLGQMSSIVGVAHGIGPLGFAVFFISPAELFGILMLVVASSLRRARAPNTIVLEILGTFCLMSTSYAAFHVEAGIVASAPFLLPVACKFPVLAIRRARREPWTRVTRYGGFVFIVGCVLLTVCTIYFRITSPFR